MPSTPRNVTPAMLGYAIWTNSKKFVLLAAVFWVLLIAAVVADLFGVELHVGRVGRDRVLDSRTATIIAMAVTTIVLVITVPLSTRAAHLAIHGVQVLGKIRQKLGVTWRSLETVRISYSYNGDTYTIKAPLGRHSDAIGTQVQLIVEPRSPRRCMLREHVFPPGFDVDA